MRDTVEELVCPSPMIACGGYRSGTENRHHQHYVALIPEWRYLDPDEVVDVISTVHVPVQPVIPRLTIPKPPMPKRRKKKYVPPVYESRYDRPYNEHMSGWPTVEQVAWAKADPKWRVIIEMGHERGWHLIRQWLEYRDEPIQPWITSLIGRPYPQLKPLPRTLFVDQFGEVFFTLARVSF
jgi:hypothetical protein